MRVRTAKKLAERIDLYYFTRPKGMRRWRILLSLALPIAAVLWVSVFAAAGNRTTYSAGPVSSAHAFTEKKCEACHSGPADPGAPRGARRAPPLFRAHSSDAACLTCHDAPAHAVNQTPPPACATCHQEHRGRVQLAKTDDRLCIDCHGSLKTTAGEPKVVKEVGGFPSAHPEFAAVKPGAQDPARLRFNHSVHLKDSLRGPTGPEKLECSTCHVPEIVRTATAAKRPQRTGLMAPITYQDNCARCHPLFFDERIDQAAPHGKPEAVHAFVQQALLAYIQKNPGDINKPDTALRRVPLNFPRAPEPPARNAQEWVTRRLAADERLLWNKTCVECHEVETTASAGPSPGRAVSLPVYAQTSMRKQWMTRAAFDHSPHLMVKCGDCHAAQGSTKTADVLLPNQAVCATCHAPAKGAQSQCFECHRYHDWMKGHPVTPSYSLTDFK
jgi:predicted CXXCH cytochrome family protein